MKKKNIIRCVLNVWVEMLWKFRFVLRPFWRKRGRSSVTPKGVIDLSAISPGWTWPCPNWFRVTFEISTEPTRSSDIHYRLGDYFLSFLLSEWHIETSYLWIQVLEIVNCDKFGLIISLPAPGRPTRLPIPVVREQSEWSYTWRS